MAEVKPLAGQHEIARREILQTISGRRVGRPLSVVAREAQTVEDVGHETKCRRTSESVFENG
jgi:hypothetical protein